MCEYILTLKKNMIMEIYVETERKKNGFKIVKKTKLTDSMK